MGSKPKPYRKYRVIKEISGVKEGAAAPWFGQPGNGTQYKLPASIDDLVEDGFLEPIVEKEIQTVEKALEGIITGMKSDFPPSWKFNKIADDAFEVVDGSGNKWATVYKDKIVAPARTAVGIEGNPILNKVPLVKNIKYEVDGFIYETDELGRVSITTADLDDIARVRLKNQQIRAVDIKDGVRGEDQGGHIIASRFFGPGEQINLYSMSANLNQGAWEQMESSWADEMVAGKDVKIQVDAVFNGASKRPDAFPRLVIG